MRDTKRATTTVAAVIGTAVWLIGAPVASGEEQKDKVTISVPSDARGEKTQISVPRATDRNDYTISIPGSKARHTGAISVPRNTERHRATSSGSKRSAKGSKPNRRIRDKDRVRRGVRGVTARRTPIRSVKRAKNPFSKDRRNRAGRRTTASPFKKNFKRSSAFKKSRNAFKRDNRGRRGRSRR